VATGTDLAYPTKPSVDTKMPSAVKYYCRGK